MTLLALYRSWLPKVLNAPRWLWALWHRPFDDARLILEQHGDLRYLNVSARVQRVAVRSAIGTSLMLVLSLLGVSISALYLNSSKSQLEDSHRAIYSALLGSTNDLDLPTSHTLSQREMMLLAQAIRDRDHEIRSIVSSVTGDLSIQNDQLDGHLAATGLTESSIDLIQESGGMGGFGRDLDTHPDPLLNGQFSDLSQRNLALKDVLLALPGHVPVSDFYVSSRFGMRTHPITGRHRFHAGVDLVTRSDDSIYPAKAGLVILARNYNSYGKTIIIRHERGIETLYAHLDSMNVTEGQEVDTTTVIGMVGNTGASTGKHLHFEVTVGGYPVDPLKVINTAKNVQQAQR